MILGLEIGSTEMADGSLAVRRVIEEQQRVQQKWRRYGGARPFSKETARTIDSEVRAIITESQDQAHKLLSGHRKELDPLVEALLAHETLNEHQILQVTGLPPAPALEKGRLEVAGADRRSAAAH